MKSPATDDHPDPPRDARKPTAATLIDICRRWYPLVLGALVIGILAAVIGAVCDYAAHFHKVLVERYPRASLLLMPLGFALCIYIMRRFCRGAQSCGIAQTLTAARDNDPQKKHHLLSPRILLGKTLALIAGTAVGAPIGRDGPMVQIGASVMHLFYGKRLEDTTEQRRLLVVAGGSAGIAVAFSAPLAGILFAVEWLCRPLTFSTFKKVLPAIVLSSLAALAALAALGHAGSPAATPLFIDAIGELPAIILCGLVGGVIGGVFSRLLIGALRRPPAVIANLMGNRPLFFALFCGIFVALLGIYSDGAVYGAGYDAARGVIDGDDKHYGLAKMAAVFLTFLSSLPGGLFAPSLAVGAGLGHGLSAMFPVLAPAAASVLVMTAYLSGVTRAPLTSAAIVLPLTAGMGMLLPLLTAALIAGGVARFVCPVPLFESLTEKYAW